MRTSCIKLYPNPGWMTPPVYNRVVSNDAGNFHLIGSSSEVESSGL